MKDKILILILAVVLLAVGGVVWYGRSKDGLVVPGGNIPGGVSDDTASLPALTPEQKTALNEGLKAFEHPETWHRFTSDYLGYALGAPNIKKDTHIKSGDTIMPLDGSYRFSFGNGVGESFHLSLEIIKKEPEDTLDNWITRHVNLRPENVRNVKHTVIAGYPALQFDSARGITTGATRNEIGTSVAWLLERPGTRGYGRLSAAMYVSLS